MSEVQPAAPEPVAPAQPTTPAGWYLSPTRPGQQQYWSGTGWAEHYAPAAQQPTARTANGMGVSYVRGQHGHSLILWILFGGILLWIPAIYYSVSPNHYWHA